MEQMTPEAKSAVMQLMGQTYGQVKKQDDMLVGASQSLQPKSTELKNMVEELVRAPVVPSHQQQPPQPVPQVTSDQPVAPVSVTPEQSMAELQQVAAPVDPAFGIHSAPVAETMEFDFSEPSAIDKLVELQKETNLLLKDIKLQLESSNVKPKRKSAVKKASAEIA